MNWNRTTNLSEQAPLSTYLFLFAFLEPACKEMYEPIMVQIQTNGDFNDFPYIQEFGYHMISFLFKSNSIIFHHNIVTTTVNIALCPSFSLPLSLYSYLQSLSLNNVKINWMKCSATKYTSIVVSIESNELRQGP